MWLEAVHARLGIDAEPVPLTGGYENDVYRLGPHVVRVAAPWIGIDRVRAEHALLRSLDLPEIAAPTHDAFEIDGRAVSIFPFRDGSHPDDEDDAIHLAAAPLLARIHIAGRAYDGPSSLPSLRDLDWDRNPIWDIGRVRASLDLLGRTPLDELEAHRVALRAEVGAMRDLTIGVIHGDYWPGNLLVADGRITAVVDWIDARRDWLAFELGRALWEFCSDDGELDEPFARTWLATYVDADGPVPSHEFDSLVTMMRVGILSDALRDLTYEPPTAAVVEYHTGSVTWLDRLEDAAVFG